MQHSAGCLLFRRGPAGWEVLLVHASGNYNRARPWNLPKGQLEPGESLVEAARRETVEETGVAPGELVSLGHADYRKTRKRVHAFAGPAPTDAAPRCASWEIDAAEFLPLEEAARRIHPDLRSLLDRLAQALKELT